jgi:hypothetical protein
VSVNDNVFFFRLIMQASADEENAPAGKTAGTAKE